MDQNQIFGNRCKFSDIEHERILFIFSLQIIILIFFYSEIRKKRHHNTLVDNCEKNTKVDTYVLGN